MEIEKSFNVSSELSFEQSESLLLIHNKNFPFSPWEKQYLNEFLQLRNLPICLRLKIDGKLAGFAIGKIDAKMNKYYVLHSLVVDEKFRGKGYGEALAKNFLKEVFRNVEIQKVIIHFRDSKNLQGFYQKIGFQGHAIVGSYKNGEKKHYMEFNRR